MKLRNKETGGLANLIVEKDLLRVKTDAGWQDYTSLKDLLKEWEDYEEPKEYFYIYADGDIYKDVQDDLKNDNGCKEIGNYFETKEEAKKAVEKLKAWKRLKDKNFHFLKYSALGCGEIEFSLDFEDMDDEGEIGQLRHDLDLLFGGEE